MVKLLNIDKSDSITNSIEFDEEIQIMKKINSIRSMYLFKIIETSIPGITPCWYQGVAKRKGDLESHLWFNFQ